MSVSITTDVFCDECGRWAHYRVSYQAHIREAQVSAKQDGWKFRRNGDCSCPECNGSKPPRSYFVPSFEGTSTPSLRLVTLGVPAPVSPAKAPSGTGGGEHD